MIKGFPDNDAEFLKLGAKFETPMKGVVVIQEFDKPDPKEFGQYLVSYLTWHGAKKELAGWTFLVLSQDQAPMKVTEPLPDLNERGELEEALGSKDYDIWFNAMGVEDLEGLANNVFKVLAEKGYCVVRGS